MGNWPQKTLCSLIFLVVVCTFVAPTLDLPETALRSKQGAASIFLGLAVLTLTVAGMFCLPQVAAVVPFLGAGFTRTRLLADPEVSCAFRC